MPVHGKKRTTPHSADSRQGQSAPALPDQDEFRQHVRELARGAIRVVLEEVMRCAASAHVGSLQEEQEVESNDLLGHPTSPLVQRQRGKEHVGKAAKREGMYREVLQVLSAW
jgi:hypothetical protein